MKTIQISYVPAAPGIHRITDAGSELIEAVFEQGMLCIRSLKGTNFGPITYEVQVSFDYGYVNEDMTYLGSCRTHDLLSAYHVFYRRA